MREDRRRWEAQQKQFEQERLESEQRFKDQQAEQRAKDNAAKLQAQLAEEARVSATDEVTDIYTGPGDEELTDNRRKRRPLELSALLGI